MISRTAREIAGLNRKVRDAHPKIPLGPIPIKSLALLQSVTRNPTTQGIPTNVISVAGKKTAPGPGRNAPRSITTDLGTPVQVQPSVDTSVFTDASLRNTTLGLHLATLSNDPLFRKTQLWNNFVSVRVDDIESEPFEQNY